MAREPKTLQEAVVYFQDPRNCHDYIVARRWPNGVVCPVCGARTVSFLKSVNRFQCSKRHPKRQFTVKTGTIFEDSPLPLSKWFVGMWLVLNCKNGVSSYELGRALGITQKSAWHLAHRVRAALEAGTFEKLSGPLEADECYIGGKSENMHRHKRKPGRGVANKTMVMGLLQRDGKVHLRVGQTASIKEIKAFIQPRVKEYEAIFTDAHAGYDWLRYRYHHATVDHAIEYVRGVVHTNGMENFWSLLKRSLKGTYVCPSPWHMFRYCNEQEFRFNLRTANDGQRFDAAMRQVSGKRLTYATLTGRTPGADSDWVQATP